MEPYNHLQIEEKWQKHWASKRLYETNNRADANVRKFYILDMFPYPSGEGLHVGHPKGYIATDVVSRMKRMQGYSVLHPMGFDAFGLPAENYAIATKTNPAIAVEKNVARYKEQLQLLGFDYDWSREINTTDPEYYRWTQWIFLQLFKKGLAYESYEPINWCPKDKTGLANEDVENGKCERCGTPVEKKMMRQWILRITNYADRLLADLDVKDEGGKYLLDWPESIKELQRNWIGRSEGAKINFALAGIPDKKIEIFTTRPDTLFGVTYVVIAPEHPLIREVIDHVSNKADIGAYVDLSKSKNEIERTDAKKEKTGVQLKGVVAINPINKERVPVWVSDYVLADYGTGAVMAVPAHDERDFVFAKKYELPIKNVITPHTVTSEKDSSYGGQGVLVNSGDFSGRESASVVKEMTLSAGGEWVTTYKLRPWVFSRQRYWGEPIPIIHCGACGIVPVPEKDLPVRLPEVDSYEPTGTGESPLAAIKDWVNVKCPQCGGPGKRETNTMPQWAGSSWYYLRYMDPKNGEVLVDKDKERYWAPVDLYVGGAEHATRHLIYARFWHKFLYDIGVVSTLEPFKRLQHVGLIMAEDGRKMSKRWGNVVNPDHIVKNIGADSLRVYEMFMGPFDQSVGWSMDNAIGARRFIERVWRLQEKYKDKDKEDKLSVSKIETLLHKTIKKVTEDIESMRFNTAISSMMILINDLDKNFSRQAYETLIQLLAPFAPHVTEELWQSLGYKESVHSTAWPVFDPKKIIESEVTIAVQINGKVRATISATPESTEKEIEDKALGLPEVSKFTTGKMPKRIIHVKNKLINIVI